MATLYAYPPADICKAASQIPENEYYPKDVIDQYVYNLTLIQGQNLELKDFDLQKYCIEHQPQNLEIVDANIQNIESEIGQTIDYNSTVKVVRTGNSTEIRGIKGTLSLGPDFGYVDYDQTKRYYLYGQ